MTRMNKKMENINIFSLDPKSKIHEVHSHKLIIKVRYNFPRRWGLVPHIGGEIHDGHPPSFHGNQGLNNCFFKLPRLPSLSPRASKQSKNVPLSVQYAPLYPIPYLHLILKKFKI